MLMFKCSVCAKKNTLIAMLFAIMVASFVACVAIPYPSDFAFFLLPMRIWELGMGSVLASLRQHTAIEKIKVKISSCIRWPVFAEISSWFGVCMIISSYFLYDEATPYPSYQALLPCVGTALFIGFSGFAKSKKSNLRKMNSSIEPTAAVVGERHEQQAQEKVLQVTEEPNKVAVEQEVANKNTKVHTTERERERECPCWLTTGWFFGGRVPVFVGTTYTIS